MKMSHTHILKSHQCFVVYPLVEIRSSQGRQSIRGQHFHILPFNLNNRNIERSTAQIEHENSPEMKDF